MAVETETVLSRPLAAPEAEKAAPASALLGSSGGAEPVVKLLTTADYKAAAACLAACFADDRVVTYPLDAEDAAHWPAAQREALYVRTFETTVYAHILRGEAVGIASGTGGFDAVALWLPPGRRVDDAWTLLRSGLWRLRWAYSAQGRARFYREFLPLLHASKADVMQARDHASWYLNYLGTRPEARGRGLARRLIRHGAAQADAAGLPVYLESSHRANVPYYARLGFVVRKTVALAHGDRPEMDLMVREPGAGPV